MPAPALDDRLAARGTRDRHKAQRLRLRRDPRFARIRPWLRGFARFGPIAPAVACGQKAYRIRLFRISSKRVARRAFCNARLQNAAHGENAIWHNTFSRGPDMHAPCAMHRNATTASQNCSRAIRPTREAMEHGLRARRRDREHGPEIASTTSVGRSGERAVDVDESRPRGTPVRTAFKAVEDTLRPTRFFYAVRSMPAQHGLRSRDRQRHCRREAVIASAARC
jgi:hypothetical protein